MKKMVAGPLQVVNELARYLAQYPQMRGQALNLARTKFFQKFRELALSCRIPAGHTHPHVLRHTSEIELVRAGVPWTVIQEILGHASLNTTAIHLYFTGVESKSILKDNGLILSSRNFFSNSAVSR